MHRHDGGARIGYLYMYLIVSWTEHGVNQHFIWDFHVSQADTLVPKQLHTTLSYLRDTILVVETLQWTGSSQKA